MQLKPAIILPILIVCLILAAGCRSAVSPETGEAQPVATATAAAQAPASPIATSTPTATLTPIEQVAAELEGLPLDTFFEESYRQLILRNPEKITELGLAEAYGLRNDRLNDLSEAYLRETQALELAILELLRSYERDTLSQQEQITYDVYEWYLDNRVRGQAFQYHNYPVNHFINSYQFNIDTLFGEIQPLEDEADVQDYITRLGLVQTQVDQLLEGLAIRTEMGVIPPRFIIQMAQDGILGSLHTRKADAEQVKAKQLAVYTRLEEETEGMPGLEAAARQAYLDAALVEIERSFIPGYLKIYAYLEEVLPLANDEAGVWKLPDGDAYYAYLLRQETTTDLSAAEIHEIGLAEVERIQEEMRQALIDLGYPPEDSLREMLDRAIDDAGYWDVATESAQLQYIGRIERMIKDAGEATAGAFNLRPVAQVIVIAGEWGGYYVPGTLDGSRPGAYHVSVGGQWRPKYSLRTITHHEAVPGHHLQIALAQEMDLPLLRNDIIFNGYVEGWALYAERLAWEMGLFEDDPYGNIGRLQYELLRAVRLVTDTGIHAKKWTRREAQQYMDEAMGARPGAFSHEVDRYIVLPAQATGYKVGMIEILRLRNYAQEALGEAFDLKEFHDVVIGNGSMPLDLLARVVEAYVEGK